jgi:hypothetical protein
MGVKIDNRFDGPWMVTFIVCQGCKKQSECCEYNYCVEKWLCKECKLQKISEPENI